MTSAKVDDEVIVVGVDGSDASRAALRWATRYGRKTGATVRAVTAWHIEPFSEERDETFERQARTHLDQAVAEIGSTQPEFRLEARLRRGDPQAVLLEEAKDADLIVFGDKGRGRVAGLLMGSVLTHSLPHAPCPVVIVGQHMMRP